MTNRTTVVLASLLGAAAVHIVLTACSGSATQNANAQSGGCAQWQISDLRSGSGLAETGKSISGGAATPGSYGSILTATAGWEPFSGDGNGGTVFRRCAQ